MRTGSENDMLHPTLRHTLAFLILSCSALPAISQTHLPVAQTPGTTTHQQVTEAQKAIAGKKLSTTKMSVAIVEVPDVRGSTQEVAQSRLREAGLQPGSVSTSPGPGVVGTVWQQEPAPNSRVRRGTVFNLVLVAAAPPKTHNPSTEMQRQVPNLVGLTPAQASDRLYGTRLFLGRVTSGTGSGTVGTIYTQNPQPLTWVPLGSKIDVEFVQSPKTPPPPPDPIWVYVPNLVGQDERTAAQLLPGYGLTLGDVSRTIASAPAGTVFGQNPLPQSKVLQGTPVSLQIALPAPSHETRIPVPNLIKRDINNAEFALRQSRLQLGTVQTVETSAAAPNSVTDQSPAPGTRVATGTRVNVVIAEAIPLVQVPNLLNHDQADALDILESAGLQLGSLSERDAEAATGTVLSQAPSAGKMVRTGTPVNLTLSRYAHRELGLMLSNPAPKRDELVRFHADLIPPQAGAKYRFSFGDFETGWLDTPDTTHVYKAGGDYKVQAFALLGNTTIISDPAQITIPTQWAGVILLTGGIVVFGIGAYVYRGWKLYRASVRLVPRPAHGTQVVSIASGRTWQPNIGLRVIHDPGQARVSVARAQKKGSGHD